MTGLLRVSLLVFSVLVLVVVIRRIRKAALEIADSIFWLGLSLALLLVAVFPGIAYAASDLLGFGSPSNFIFFCGIIVLLARTLTQDQKITTLKKKLTTLTQTEALREADEREGRKDRRRR